MVTIAWYMSSLVFLPSFSVTCLELLPHVGIKRLLIIEESEKA